MEISKNDSKDKTSDSQEVNQSSVETDTEPLKLDIDPVALSIARLWNVARILNPENPSPPSILPSDLD